ncbi:MAG: hypothetical protein ABJH45_12570 [Paracoccaceae bacterium]
MAMDEAKITELKDAIAFARKRELSFGLCLGKKAENTVLVTHKTKAPAALGKQAKSDGETGYFTFGKMSVTGKEMTFVIEGKMLAGITKKIKELMKVAGLAAKVIILDPQGNTADSDSDEEEVAETSAGKTKAPEVEPEESRQSTEDVSAQAEAQEGETPAGAQGGQQQSATRSAIAKPLKVGAEPSKRDLSIEFKDVSKDLMKAIGQLERPAQDALKGQLKQFGDLMKEKNFSGAQKLMDDLSTMQGTVTEAQRSRTRDDLSEIDNLMGDVEAEMNELEAAMRNSETAA